MTHAALETLSDTLNPGLKKQGMVPPRRGAFGLGWLMWGLSLIFVLFQFFLQLSSGEIVEGLMKSFSLTALGGGVLASAYYYIYVTLQVPAGMMVDYFGPRRLLGISAAICALGCWVFASSDTLGIALLGRLLMGTGAACAFVSSLNLISRWFPAHRFAVMTGISETVGMLGSLLGGFLLADIITHYGWRDAILGAAAIGAVITVLLWSIIRDTPKNVTQLTRQSPTDLWKNMRQLVKNPIAWINGFYSGAMFSSVTVFVALWGIPFMEKAHHLTLLQATLTCNVMFIGVAVGSPIVGWLESRFPVRRLLLTNSALVAAALLSLLIYCPHIPLVDVISLMFTLGIAASSYVLNFVIANEICSPQARGTSIGFVNMLSVLPAPLLQPLLGLILFLESGHRALHQMTAYSLPDFQLALTIIPAIVLIAGLLAWRLPK